MGIDGISGASFRFLTNKIICSKNQVKETDEQKYTNNCLTAAHPGLNLKGNKKHFPGG